ncbi:MAG: ribosome recycling factor [Candidatus Poribacteria bacterium]|nr:ribosome recycling factor [Candidatus Poribacteria bacterium]
MPKTILRDVEVRMKKALESTAKDFAHVQTGRASSALLDGIQVEYYGTKSPINQVATINIPEPRLIVIQPWDKTVIKDVEKAIARSDLGLNPNSDGNVIRIQIPELTTERRKELTRYVSKSAEEGRVAIRNIRRDANDSLQKIEKSKEISKDERHTYESQVQEMTDSWIDQVDNLLKSKEEELMEL